MALNIEKTKFEILKEISNTHCEIKCCKCNATRVGRTNYYKKITEISCDNNPMLDCSDLKDLLK